MIHRFTERRSNVMLLRTLALVAVVFLIGNTANAQQDLATIQGSVTDQTGAFVAGATVTISSQAANVERTATTSEDGTFTVPQLRPGTYTVSVEQAGFDTATATEVQLGVGQNRQLDFALAVAGTGTTDVNVVADSVTLETDSARLGANVTAREVLELPVNGRNVSQLYNLAPGAQNNGTGNFNEIRFNARSNQQNQQRLDGIEATAVFDASPGYLTVQGSQFRLQTSLENIQEFRVDSSNYPAEYGTGTGGQINIVGKSGSNNFNGSLFEYFRNDKLDARNFFDGAEKSKLRLNQFGGSLGGRIVSDRLFFFGSYEGLRQRAGFNIIETTLSQQARDFVNFFGTSDPRGEAARAALGISSGAAAAAVAPGANNSASRLANLRATGLLNTFPVGNRPDLDARTGLAASQNFIQTNNVAQLDEDAFSIRFDANLDQAGKFTFFTRYQRDTGELISPDGTTNRFLLATQQPDNFVTSLQQIYGTNVVNETKIGFNRAPTTLTTQTPTFAGVNGFDLTSSSINLGGSIVNPGVNGGASTGLSTPGGLTRQSSAGNGRAQPIDAGSFSLIDNLSIVAGNHQLKFGGEYRNISVSFDQLGGTTFSFGSVNDFLLNQNVTAAFIGDLSAPGDFSIATNPITTFRRPVGGAHRGQQYYLIGYGQDQWNIRPNLTINYGLRYEFYSTNRERDDRAIIFDAGSLRLQSSSVLPLRPEADKFYTGIKGNFGPRLALTYSPQRRLLGGLVNNSTVFRVGGGLYYGPGQYEDLIQPIESDVFRTTATGSLSPTFNNVFANTTLPQTNFTPRAYDVNGYRVPERVAQYGASIQQELPGNTVLTLAYVGSQGRNLFQRSIVNRILQGQAVITGGGTTALPAGVGVINRIDPATGRVAAVTTARELTLINQALDTTAGSSTFGTVVARNGSNVSPFGEIDFKTSGGRDNYNALQATLNRRFTAGLTLGAQYTYGHSIGTTQGSNEAQTAQNPFDFNQERGNNTFDIRHSANVTALYELPVGENRFLNLGSVGNSIFGGLQLGGIYNGRSGVPLDIRITRADLAIRCNRPEGCPVTANANGTAASNTGFIPFGTIGRFTAPGGAAANPALPPGFIAIVNTPGGNASRNTRRPDYVAGANPYADGDGLNFLNPAAFTIPQPGTYGNLGRNALFGPVFHQFDLTLQKRFRITEGTNIEFRTEVYNLFNKANFANPPVLLTEQLPNITAATDAATGIVTTSRGTGIQPGQPFASTGTGGVPNFGLINSTVGRTVGLGTNRQIQFALRLNF